MGLIKLRTEPEELHRMLKSGAAIYGGTLEAFCTHLLVEGVNRRCIGDVGGSIPAPSTPDDFAPDDRPAVYSKAASCKSCGSVGGVHARGCNA